MYEIFERTLKEKGITAYKLSKDTGISTATLTSWKQGKYVPKQDKLQIIADYLGISIDYLLTGKLPDDKSYYMDDDAAETASKIFENDKVLFDVYNSSYKDRLIEYARMLKMMREKEKGD